MTLFRLVCYLERQIVALQAAGPQEVLEDLARRVGRLEAAAAELAEDTDSHLPAAASIKPPDLCAVCHLNPVDTASGFDTCEVCLSRQ